MRAQYSIKSMRSEFSCTEDFTAMSPTDRGAHCASCDKEVFDLLSYSDSEIITFLENLKSNELCARLTTAQIDSINKILDSTTNRTFSNKLYPLLFTIVFGLSSCGTSKKNLNAESPGTGWIVKDSELIKADSVLSLTGRIVDDMGNGVPNANVSASDSLKFDATDMNGYFQLDFDINSDVRSIHELNIGFLGIGSFCDTKTVNELVVADQELLEFSFLDITGTTVTSGIITIDRKKSIAARIGDAVKDYWAVLTKNQ